MLLRRPVGIALVTLAAFICRGSADAHDYGKVELLRDHWGVPHVFADTDAGAMYGLGYAAGARSRSDVPGDEVAMGIDTMFRFVNTELAFVYGGGESGLSHFLKTVGRRLDQDPQADINAMEQRYVDRLLAQAWTGTARTRGRGDGRQAAERGREPVANSRKLGFCESLDGFPSVDPALDLPVPHLACTDGATVFSQGAQAYVQWVPLHDVDGAKSLLPPGQSERPDSPTRTINMEGWGKGELHAAPITRPAIEAVVESRKTL
jgi:hypothetical protein